MKYKSKQFEAVNRAINKLDTKVFQHVRDAQNSYCKGEQILLKAYRRAKAVNNHQLLSSILSQTAWLYSMAGWTSRAYEILLQREKLYPMDLHAKLRIADFYFRHGGDYLSTLRKLAQVKLPTKPGKLDFDAYHNALALKGQALLMLGKEREAVSVMKEFAEFTATHLDKTIFFRDLYFATEMVNSRLGLRHCQRYLNTIDKTEQVPHDQVATKKLLKTVNHLLGK